MDGLASLCGPRVVLLVGAWPVLLAWAVAKLLCPWALGAMGIWTGGVVTAAWHWWPHALCPRAS